MRYKATVMDTGAVGRAIKRIAHEIVEKNGGCDNLCIMGIKTKGVPLARLIADSIGGIEGVEISVGELDIKHYRDDLTKPSDDPVVCPVQNNIDVAGKNVVLVDDVIYTGRTVRAAMDAVMSIGRPSRIMLAVLVDRGHRELPIKGDFVGKNVPTARQERIIVKLEPCDEEASVELYE